MHLQNFFAVSVTFKVQSFQEPRLDFFLPKSALFRSVAFFSIAQWTCCRGIIALYESNISDIVYLGTLHRPGLPLAYCLLAKSFISAERINAKNIKMNNPNKHLY